MRLNLELPTKKWPRPHLTLTGPAREAIELRHIIEEEVLGGQFRVEREWDRTRDEVKYFFALKHLEKLRLTLPYADIGKRLDRKLVKEAVEQYNDAPAPHVFVPGLNVRLMGLQKKFVRWYMDLPSPKTAFLTDDMGTGKGHRPSTKVLTPSGWTTVGELQVGDSIVGSDGQPHTVTGVFHRGEMDYYKVYMNDGAMVECSDDHLWSVNTALRRARSHPGRVMELHDIRKNLRNSVGNLQHFIPVVAPIEFAPKDTLPVNPYLLGVLLGDGCLRNSSVSFATEDPEIVEYVQQTMPRSSRLRKGDKCSWHIAGKQHGTNELLSLLRECGAYGHLAQHKSIPVEYLFASISDRLSMIQGLMDTDGTVDRRSGQPIFGSTSLQLVQGIEHLVRSLGGTTRRQTPRKRMFAHNGEKRIGLLTHQVSIKLPPQFCPFRLARKIAVFKPPTKYPPARAIEQVVYSGRDQIICISVDSPDKLYVTEDFIVTHNTLSSLAIVQKLGYEHVLVVCPNSAKWTAWAGDIETKCRGLDYVVVDGNAYEREAQLRKHSRITIINYEALWRHEDVIKDLHYDLLIADEFHRVKSPTAKQTLALFAVNCTDKLLMSGTPMLNGRIEELWSGLHRMWPDRFSNHYGFKAYHCIRGNGNRVVAYRHLDVLRRQTEPFEMRRRKDQVMKDLPAMIKVRREVELTAEGRKLYNAIIDDMILWLEDGEQKQVLSMLSQITRLKQASFSPELYGGSKTSPKLTELKEIVAELVANGEKAIVFSQWKKATRIIQRELAQYNPAYVDGTVPAKNRAEQVRRFQHDEDCKVFIGTIGSCREAITLTAASYVVFTDKGWTPAENEQAAARAHRYGQKRTVHVIELYAKDTIEDHIEDLLKKKQNVMDAYVDRRGHISRKAIMSVDSIRELLVKV